MFRQKIGAIIQLIMYIVIGLIHGIIIVIFDNERIDGIQFRLKKFKKPKPDKEKFEKFMKRVTK